MLRSGVKIKPFRFGLVRRLAPVRGCLQQQFSSGKSKKESSSTAPTPSNVIRTLHRVQELLGHKFKMSRVVLCGDQSSGKTSVLEALIGQDLSVKDNSMATRRPLLLSLIHNREGGPMWAQFRGDTHKQYNFADVKARIAAENEVTDGNDVSTAPIELTLCSENVFDTIIVDLPGFIFTPRHDQSQSLPEQIEKVNLPYLDDPQNIIAVVGPAPQDPATSQALRHAQRADPEQKRCLGIVTKIDLVGKDKSHLINLLSNSIFPLGLGRIGIRCRTHHEQLNNLSFDNLIAKEQKWISSSGIDAREYNMGIPVMRRRLSELLINRLMVDMPSIISRLDDKIAAARHNKDFLTRLASEGDMRTVSKELEQLVNQLHPATDARRDFEERLRAGLYRRVCESFQVASHGCFTGEHTEKTHTTDHYKDWQGSGRMLQDSGYLLENVPGEESLRNLARYRELMVYGGEGHMDGVTQQSIDALSRRAIEVGATAGFFTHGLPKNPRRARREWFRGLGFTIDNLLGREKLLDKVFAEFLVEIQSFADTGAEEIGRRGQGRDGASAGSQTELAVMYYKYLLSKVATRIHSETLQHELVGMVERERRPVADLLALQNEISKIEQHPTNGTFFSSSPVKVVELFNSTWTEGYLKLASKRVSDDIFRIIAVRLLEPLVFECIQYSLNLFGNSGKVKSEAKSSDKELEELQQLRDTLQATVDQSNASTR